MALRLSSPQLSRACKRNAGFTNAHAASFPFVSLQSAHAASAKTLRVFVVVTVSNNNGTKLAACRASVPGNFACIRLPSTHRQATRSSSWMLCVHCRNTCAAVVANEHRTDQD